MLRKAAVLVACLDRQSADALLGQLTLEQAQRVRRAVVQLGPIETDEEQDVLTQFVRIGPQARMPATTGVELDGLLAEHNPVPRMSLRTASDAPPRDDAPFRFLHETQLDAVAALLKREHPQTIAVVLAHLGPEQAAEVLSSFADDLQVAVMRRLAYLEEADPDVVRDVERGIDQWLRRQGNVGPRHSGVGAVERILQSVDVGTHRELLAKIARSDQRLAQRLATHEKSETVPTPAPQVEPLRRACFDDLAELSDDALSGVIDAANQHVVALALVGASDSLLQRVLRVAPPPRAREIRRSIANLGPTTLRDIEAAQHELARLACCEQLLTEHVAN